MSTVVEQAEASVLRVLQGVVKGLEDALPMPLEVLAKGLLTLPPVASEVAKLEAAAADFVGKELTAVEAKAYELAPDWLKKLLAQAAPPQPFAFDCSAKAADKLAHMTSSEIDTLLGVA